MDVHMSRAGVHIQKMCVYSQYICVQLVSIYIVSTWQIYT